MLNAQLEGHWTWVMRSLGTGQADCLTVSFRPDSESVSNVAVKT